MPELDKFTVLLLENLEKDLICHRPAYCPEIETENDVSILSENLPLICIWNEKNIGNQTSFTISLNGKMFGRIFRTHFNTGHPNYQDFYDLSHKSIYSANKKIILSVCEKYKVLPSIAFKRT